MTLDYSQTRPVYIPRVFNDFTSIQSHELRIKFHRKIFENLYVGFGTSVRFYSETKEDNTILLRYRNTFLGLSPNLSYFIPLDPNFDLYFGLIGTLEQGVGSISTEDTDSGTTVAIGPKVSLREIFFIGHLEIGTTVHFNDYVSILAAFNTFAITRNRSRFGTVNSNFSTNDLSGWQMRDFSGQPDFRVGVLLRFYRDYY
ncbi:hypothetical protein A3SI_08781 [Nitritalea halalkaliphila LW7]|uniref:Uncharacterized protein n=2 Tax=Nitritalea TaxID=1187887 RepID=I5C4N5_9BACT|nr:hypothetical protein A3SI_08781 [Nitritalea halalkaliphila LW7]